MRVSTNISPSSPVLPSRTALAAWIGKALVTFTRGCEADGVLRAQRARWHPGLAPTLVVCAASALLSAPASARNLVDGASHTVQAGDAEDFWNVRDASELTVAPGGTVSSVQLMNSALLEMQPGSVANGTINLGNFSAMNATGASFVGGIAALVSTVSLIDSTVTNSTGPVALRLQGFTLAPRADVVNTRLIGLDGAGGPGVGLQFIAGNGSANLTRGSLAYGDTNGVQIVTTSGSGQVNLLVDHSTVSGGNGAAILAESRSGTQNARIAVRNGSQLLAGNGVLLQVGGAVPNTVDFAVEASDLVGDVRADAGHTLDVTLTNSATLRGNLIGVNNASLANGGTWFMAADTRLGSLDLGSGGIVSLGDGTAFHTLTVAGNYTGSGGTLRFNTVLGEDGSATDKLIVNGDTSGQTNVAVNNVGGTGAQTINGIQLIQVEGLSDGRFTLTGRAVGGQYEYFLHQGTAAAPGDGHWYLRSELPGVPDPCAADPSLPGCTPVAPPDPSPCLIDPARPECTPVVPPPLPETPEPEPVPTPVLRPEPGAYLANQTAATQMFGMRLQDRTGGMVRGPSERGAWARVSRNQARYGVIGDQLSVDGDNDVLQLGTDVLTWGEGGRGRLGVMLGSGRATTTVSSRLTGYVAKGKVTGQAVGVYGTWLQDPSTTTGMYVDAWASHAQFNNSVQGDALAKERYDSRASSASIEAGYGVQVAGSGGVALFVEPQLQLSYTHFTADNHTETNGTTIDGSAASGLTTRAGVRVFGHANTEVGNRVQPFIAVNWLRESSDNSLRLDGERLSGGLPKNRYEARAGASLQLGSRWTAWGDLGLQRGDGGYKDVIGQIGLRSNW